MNTNDRRKKMLAAKPDVDAAIKKHGLEAVRYVVTKRLEAERLTRQLAKEKQRLNERIQEIESKLAKK